MRKCHYIQISELLKTIELAQREGMFADCQAGAQAVGNFIESIEGEGTKTVSLLEDYCEKLYQVSCGELNDKALRNSLQQIKNSVRNELKPNKLEIAFLSYNASMSDAIESIYHAAKADPQCDAYWIPIPYWDRKSDGSAGVMHFDGPEQYPGIECADWRKYDIKARRPDVIVTFAPYDGANYVTSVHPNFYCQRLRELTDMLVYVPYFVTPDELQVQEHFCTLPGCVFAHKVIVQSEKIRDVYIRAFKKQYDSQFGRPEDKFVALGSPKFDAVFYTERENISIPSDWEPLIQNAGSKKIVLYNTTIAPLLSDSDQHLKKLRDVLNTFRGRNDVLLWWRPHPLMEATLTSMRPRYLSPYKRLVETYRREGWGIYDDTADLHRAIEYCDAYYGDPSSVVTLYSATGKPIMMQNIGRSIEEPLVLRFWNIFDDGKDFWFAAQNINGLFKLDTVTWKAEYMGSIPGETAVNAYSSVVKNGDKLYLAPLSASKIAVFDLSSSSFHMIALAEPSEYLSPPCQKIAKFIDAVSHKNWVFFIPYSYPAVVRLDVNTEELTYISDWVPRVEPYISKRDRYYWSRPYVSDGHFYAAGLRSNLVMDFDMDRCTATLHEVGPSEFSYSAINFDGKDFWLAPNFDGALVRWNPATGQVTAWDQFPEGYKGDGYSLLGFLSLCIAGGKKWLIPAHANQALCFDEHSGEQLHIAEMLQGACECAAKRARSEFPVSYLFGKAYGDILYAYAYESETLISYDTASGERREQHITFSPDQLKSEPFQRELYKNIGAACGSHQQLIISEDALHKLEGYLDHFVCNYDRAQTHALRKEQKVLFEESAAHAGHTAGQAIYDHLKTSVLG